MRAAQRGGRHRASLARLDPARAARAPRRRLRAPPRLRPRPRSAAGAYPHLDAAALQVERQTMPAFAEEQAVGFGRAREQADAALAGAARRAVRALVAARTCGG